MRSIALAVLLVACEGRRTAEEHLAKKTGVKLEKVSCASHDGDQVFLCVVNLSGHTPYRCVVDYSHVACESFWPAAEASP